MTMTNIVASLKEQQVLAGMHVLDFLMNDEYLNSLQAVYVAAALKHHGHIGKRIDVSSEVLEFEEGTPLHDLYYSLHVEFHSRVLAEAILGLTNVNAFERSRAINKAKELVDLPPDSTSYLVQMTKEQMDAIHKACSAATHSAGGFSISPAELELISELRDMSDTDEQNSLRPIPGDMLNGWSL